MTSCEASLIAGKSAARAGRALAHDRPQQQVGIIQFASDREKIAGALQRLHSAACHRLMEPDTPCGEEALAPAAARAAERSARS